MNVCVSLVCLLAAVGQDNLPAAPKIPGARALAIGVNNDLDPLYCWVEPDEDFYHPIRSDKRRILLLAGLDGDADSSTAALNAFQQWLEVADPQKRDRYDVAVITIPPSVGEAMDADFPPKADAYNTAQRPAASYLWRWIGLYAPDLVIDVRIGDVTMTLPRSGESADWLAGLFPNGRQVDDTSLIVALANNKPANVGSVSALRIAVPKSSNNWLNEVLETLTMGEGNSVSSARKEMRSRLARSPVEVAGQLARIYGHSLKPVMYIPALAVMGRLELAERQGDATVLTDVEKMVKPYADGSADSLDKPNGSVISGHLVFGDLARRTEKREYLKLAQRAADQAFDEQGQPKEAMPFHSEMSDSVFMGCAILAQVGKLTGDRRYFDMCARHFEFMKPRTLRPDFVYRHSPLDEAAWGRGNGFPALGLALTLTDLPTDHPSHAAFLEAFQKHMRAMADHQDFTGHWHQVIDHPGSYRELTSTCMISFAMARGLRMGWLEPQPFARCVERAWPAISQRVASDGGLVDVCTGTGKQTSLRAYFDRTALLGKDDRGGAMALIASLEIQRYQETPARQ